MDEVELQSTSTARAPRPEPGTALDGLWLALQPLRELEGGRVVAYEALLRVDPAVAEGPAELVQAASEGGWLDALGRRVRGLGAELGPRLPLGRDLYLNVEPAELSAVAEHPGGPLVQLAHRVTFEITERLDGWCPERGARAARRLRRLGFAIAIDDHDPFGPDDGRLEALDPSVVKLDRGALARARCDARDFDRLSRAIEALRAEGRTVVQEGIEDRADLLRARALGATHGQGWYLGRPAPALGLLARRSQVPGTPPQPGPTTRAVLQAIRSGGRRESWAPA
jgi:EAL domain-containing protein (putative c-di-GMP-specific phosphodiesterase class I)